MTVVIGSVAEAKELIGRPLGTSTGLVIDQERIDRFADATGDYQWIHVDPQRAATGQYGATIAHGCLTQAVVPFLLAQIYTIGFGTARPNYGSNKVRFPGPVTVGSTVRAAAVITVVREAASGVFVTTHVTITADNAAKPACVAETITLVLGGGDDA